MKLTFRWLQYVLLSQYIVTSVSSSLGPLQTVLQSMDVESDMSTCLLDLSSAEKSLTIAAKLLEEKAYGAALTNIGDAVHDMSIAVTPCHVQDLKGELDQLSTVLHSPIVQWLDDGVKIWIGEANIEGVIEKMAASWTSGDLKAFEEALSELLVDIANLLKCGPSDTACQVLDGVLTELAKVSRNFDTCMKAVTPLKTDLDQVIADYNNKNVPQALKDLSTFFVALGNAAGPCQLTDLQNILTQTGNKLQVATISSSGIITVGPVDITKYIMDLFASLSGGNYKKAGADITMLLAALRTNGCSTPMCQIVDGLLQAAGIIAYDMGDCVNSLEGAELDFNNAVVSFKNKEFVTALGSIEKGLDVLATGVHSCQLDSIGKLIDLEASKLSKTNITIAESVVSIMFEGADIFAPLDLAIRAYEAKNYDVCGAAVASLVNTLRRTACKSEDKACVFIEGVLQTFEIVVSDIGECATDLKTSAAAIEASFVDFNEKNYKQGLTDLGAGLNYFAQGARVCQFDELADVITAEASKLGLANIQILSDVVHIIVEGADVYGDLYQSVMAFQHGDYATAGRALGQLLTDTKVASCTSPICEMLTAAIEAVTSIAPDLTACEAKLEAAWADFQVISTDLQQGDYVDALKALSRGLEETATAIQPCNLAREGAILANIAQQLGFSTVSKDVNGVMSIIVAGADIYDNLFQAGMDISKKDYGAAGGAIGRIMSDILKWHYANGCDSPACYVLEGMSMALGIVESDFKECEADISAAFIEVENAISAFKKHTSFRDASAGILHGIKWNVKPSNDITTFTPFDDEAYIFRNRVLRGSRRLSWWSNIKQKFRNIVTVVEDDVKTDWNAVIKSLKSITEDSAVNDGFKDLAIGLDDVAKGMKACHAEELVQIMTKLSLELGDPAIGWISTAFNIIINGAQLYDDAYNAVVDYEAKNYLGMGFEIAKFAVVIVKDL